MNRYKINSFSIISSKALLLSILYLLFPLFLSGQIFQSKKNSIYIKEGTVVSSKDKPEYVRKEKTINPAKIYIVSGTVVSNFNQNTHVKIVYLQKAHKKSEKYVYNKPTRKRKINHTKPEEKNPKPKYIIVLGDKNESIIYLFQYYGTPSTTHQSYEYYAILSESRILKIPDFTGDSNISSNTFSEKIRILSAYSIRPPPLV